MSYITETKPNRVSADNLAEMAAQGVKRALEARNAPGVTLSETELEQVSGGLFTSYLSTKFYTPKVFPWGQFPPFRLNNFQMPQAGSSPLIGK